MSLRAPSGLRIWRIHTSFSLRAVLYLMCPPRHVGRNSEAYSASGSSGWRNTLATAPYVGAVLVGVKQLALLNYFRPCGAWRKAVSVLKLPAPAASSMGRCDARRVCREGGISRGPRFCAAQHRLSDP